jgi:alanine racemase
MYRKTYAEIDLRAIADNLRAFREYTGGRTRILLPVKANAYGHGIIEVSSYAEETGTADVLGISSPDEAKILREAGINLPLLNMGLILPVEEQVKAVFDYSITQTVADYKTAKLISEKAAGSGKKAVVHVKIDTGMGRIGCSADDAVTLIKKISDLDNIILEGVYTHYPVADEPEREMSRKQISTFRKIIEKLARLNIEIPVKHISQSAGTINFTDDLFDMIRPGIMSYGYQPLYGMKSDIKVIPAMTLKSCIVFTKRVKEGTGLSYGLTYTTETDTNIATVAIGYGDGYSRALSNRAKVIIEGKEYPVVGRVTMDQIIINLGNDRFEAGQEVILFGKEMITVDDIAHIYDTISYEVTCQITSRVPRVYLR